MLSGYRLSKVLLQKSKTKNEKKTNKQINCKKAKKAHYFEGTFIVKDIKSRMVLI